MADSTIEPDADIFETGFSALFNVPEINLGGPGSIIPIRIPGLAPTLSLHVADPEARNTSLFSHHIWKASILLARLIVNGKYGIDIRGKNVLEFGAAAGLPSIVAASVVATDYPDPAIIDTLKRNLSLNLDSKISVRSSS
eukprot:jgi/Hompol1/3990/HPOL_006923-RA